MAESNPVNAMDKATQNVATGLAGKANLLMIIGVVGILLVLILPLPSWLLDLLITLNISTAFLVLLIILNISSPLDLNTFPTLLLFTTLLRLALNVASTRLILLHADAGAVIKAFGDFVVGGSFVVGIVIFLILVVIQFIVITKGATRISEVAARFTLDAMPGKQMAIDADLNAGLITNEEATDRREKIQHEAEFFGAMDGATKFVRGDAVAGLIITAINIAGGLLIGCLFRDMEAMAALKTYSILTVGDGLVSQIPSLIISTAAGIMVTKAASRKAMAGEIADQMVAQPGPILSAAAIIALLGFIPGLPSLPFLFIAGILLFFWSTIRNKKATAHEEARSLMEGEANEMEKEKDSQAPTPEEILQVDRLGIEIGYRLIGLVEDRKDGGLLDHIGVLRRQFATRTGLIIPPIRVKDNIQLEPNNYRVLLNGQEVGSGELRAGHYLAMDPGGGSGEIDGIDAIEPAFGLPGKWITDANKVQAEIQGYTVIDATSVLITHITEILKRHSFELLSREDVHALLEAQKGLTPTVVEELVPNQLTPGQIQKVLQNCLREQVSVRNFGLILETLADGTTETKDLKNLTERVRQRLARSIVEPFTDDQNRLHAVILAPELERSLADAVVSKGGDLSTMPHGFLGNLVDAAASQLQEAVNVGHEPVLVTRAVLRPILAEALLTAVPGAAVVSYQEAAVAGGIEPLGQVEVKQVGA